MRSIHNSLPTQLDIADTVISEVALADLPTRPSPCLFVGLHDGARRRRMELIARDASVEIIDAPDVTQLSPGLVDVAVLDPGVLGVHWSSLISDPRYGYPELVFVVPHLGSPEEIALLTRGLRHVVSDDQLDLWLRDALPRLAQLARARRLVVAASESSRGVSAGSHNTLMELSLRWPRMPLHAAESRYREIYMRSLLAEFGSRRAAASAAGVPYRSFCEMLRKLGI